MRVRDAVGGLVVLVVCPAMLCAVDWNQWRGPDRNGVAAESPGLLETWSGEGPPQVWRNGSIVGPPSNSPGSPSPYGLWGALGTRGGKETIEEQLNQ